MAPRLPRHLLRDRCRKAPQPAQSRKQGHDRLARLLVNDGVDTVHVWVLAHVVVHGRQLDQLAEKGNVARGAEILVPDDALAHGCRLVLRGTGRLQDVEGFDAAVKLKRHVGGNYVGGGGAQIVEETGQCQGGRRQRRSKVWKLLFKNSSRYE